MKAPPPRLLDNGLALAVTLDGAERRFHALWLRDNASEPHTRDPDSGQRRMTVLDISADLRIASAAWQGDRLAIMFMPDGTHAEFDPAWLIANAYDRGPPPPRGWTADDVTRWDAAHALDLPIHDHDAIGRDPGARRRWLQALRRYGFARAGGAPTVEGTACAVAALFGYVRETNYGRAFDVRIKARPDNLAYSDLALQPHTDNPYRDPVPGVQILACRHNTSTGGETILVDGFKAAERLRDADPQGFALLAGYCARFAYGERTAVRLRAKRPIIELGVDGELRAIRFNNRSAAPFVDVPFDVMIDYYAAYRRLAALIEQPDLQLRFRLSAGDLFVVDNLRVLHGRESFAGAGERWLEGCYADRDGLLSTLAVLEGGDGNA